MHAANWIVALSLFSQTASIATTNESDDSTAVTVLAPVGDANKVGLASLPTELMDGLLNLPVDAKVSGRPTSLVTALSQTSDRSRQVQIAGAYWKTVAGIADFHAAWKQERHFEQLMPLIAQRRDAEGQLELETRLTTARAETEEAKLWIATAQYELAEKAGLATNEGLPLPNDKPHLGTYITHHAEIFAGRAAPIELERIEKSLPLERDAIEAHAKAVQAAVDAFSAAREAFAQGKLGWRPLAASVERMCAAERSLAVAVLRYNADIASYALSVAPPEMQGANLVGMLIKLPNASLAANVDPNVSRATFDQGSTPPAANQPTLAPPKGALTPAPNANNGATNLPLRAIGPTGVSRDANREPIPDITAASLYGGLVTLSPGRRAEELASLLHWNRGTTTNSTSTISLADALSRSTTDRRTLIAAYWRACQATAQYQALTQQAEQLDALQTKLLAVRAPDGASDAMLRLEAVRSNARAAVLDARVTMLAEQAALAKHLSVADGTTPPVPSTAPHGGEYRVAEEHQNASLARRAEQVVGLQRALALRATAAVMSDSHTASIAGLHTPGITSDDVLVSIERTTADTLAFLDLLTQYNQEIADYTLERLGPAGSTGDISSFLVLQ